MFNVDPPELTVASAVTVYTLSTLAIVNTSPAWGAEVKTYTNVFLSDGTDGIDVRTICSNGQAVTINNIKFQLVNGSAAVMTNMEDDDFTGDTP